MFEELNDDLKGLEELALYHLRWCERQEREREDEQDIWCRWVESIQAVAL